MTHESVSPSPGAPGNENAALLEAGLAHHRAGRLDDAQALYRRILERQPGHPGAQHYLGVMALGRGDLAEAAQLMDRALAQAPDDAEILGNRGVVAANLGEHAAAAMQRKAIEIAPDFANAHNNLGNALMELGDLACAEQYYRRARTRTALGAFRVQSRSRARKGGPCAGGHRTVSGGSLLRTERYANAHASWQALARGPRACAGSGLL